MAPTTQDSCYYRSASPRTASKSYAGSPFPDPHFQVIWSEDLNEFHVCFLPKSWVKLEVRTNFG